ncbi:MAG: hypothetical protein ACKO2G_11765 [Verrucomicrobiales bacterium]
MFLRYTTSIAVAILSLLFLPARSQAQEQPTPEKKEQGAMIRILCVQSLSGDKDETITLAQKAEDGKWTEFGDLELRSPFITNWLRVPAGVNHVVRKQGGEFVSLASFTVLPEMKGAILILIPNMKERKYRLQLIDPAKLEFQKGKALVVNYSKIPALVNMGNKTTTVAPGQQYVETIKADKDGMHRMVIGHLDKDKKIIPCYDRFVSSDPETRKFVLLFPDPDTGLRAMTLSEFDTNQ